MLSHLEIDVNFNYFRFGDKLKYNFKFRECLQDMTVSILTNRRELYISHVGLDPQSSVRCSPESESIKSKLLHENSLTILNWSICCHQRRQSQNSSWPWRMYVLFAILEHKVTYNLQERQYQRYCDFKGVHDSRSMLVARAKGIQNKKKKDLLEGCCFYKVRARNNSSTHLTKYVP